MKRKEEQIGKSWRARGDSATRDEVQTMLSRLPDHGIVVKFHFLLKYECLK